jgi:pimeloyl-ACP methyl ester carboxylesterase
MKISGKSLLTAIAIIIITVATGCTTPQRMRSENISTVTSADGSPITYGVRGKGDTTLVFVHCWTCNHEFWRPQIEYFSSKYQVVWLDLAGHGLSGSHRTQYTMASFGQDVASVVNKIKADNVVLVGHSMGGPVVIEAAKILGNKIIGVVGVDTFYTPFQYPDSEAKIKNFVKPFEDDFKTASEQLVRSMFTPTADQDLVTSIVNQMSTANPNMGVSAMYEIFRWNAKKGHDTLNAYSDILRNINATPSGDEKALDKSVSLIPGVGHFVAQAKPDEFNKVLSDILVEYESLHK